MGMRPYSRFQTMSSEETLKEQNTLQATHARLRKLAIYIVMLLIALTFLPWIVSPSRHGLAEMTLPKSASFSAYTLVESYANPRVKKKHRTGKKSKRNRSRATPKPSATKEIRPPGEQRTVPINFLRGEDGLGVDTGKIVQLAGNTSYCDCVRRSSLVSKECDNPKSRFEGVFQILITGIGRSGTDFIHAELWRLGIRMSHDNHIVFRMVGSVAWPEAFNALPFRTKSGIVKSCLHPRWNFQLKNFGYKHVFHLVRDPLHTIQSRFNLGRIHAFLGITNCNMSPWPGPALCTTMQHWTLWNSFVEQTASYRFRLEDVDSASKHIVLTEIAERGKLKELKGFNEAVFQKRIDNVTVSALRNSGHTKKAKKKLTWQKLTRVCSAPYVAIAQIQALRYGYTIPKENLLPEVWDECAPANTTLKVQRCFFKKDARWTCALFSDACRK